MNVKRIVLILSLLWSVNAFAQVFVEDPQGRCNVNEPPCIGNNASDYATKICEKDLTDNLNSWCYSGSVNYWYVVNISNSMTGDIKFFNDITSSYSTAGATVNVYSSSNLNTPVFSSSLTGTVDLPFSNSNYPNISQGEYYIHVNISSINWATNSWVGISGTLDIKFGSYPTCVSSTLNVNSCGPYYWEETNKYYYVSGSYLNGQTELQLNMPVPYCAEFSYASDLPICIGVNDGSGLIAPTSGIGVGVTPANGTTSAIFSLDQASLLAGITIDASSGAIDFSNYSPVFGDIIAVTYTLTGDCSSSFTENLTVNVHDSYFEYDQQLYDNSDPNPLPSVGKIGVDYTSSLGLVIDNVTGEIDLAASVPNTYLIERQDECGGVDDFELTIEHDSRYPLDATIVGSVDCANIGAGAAEVFPSGGYYGYTYSWSSGGTSNAEMGLLGGNTYTVTVSDGTSSVVRSLYINSSPAMSIDLDIVNNACLGSADGVIMADVSSGTPGYTYSWSNAASTTSQISGLTAGTYTVTVTDDLGCSQEISGNVVDPTVLTGTTVFTSVTTTGGSDGTLTATGIGGTPGYTYQWSNGMTTATITGLSAGTYTVTITDLNSCTVELTEYLYENPSLDVLASVVTHVDCHGAANGSAFATVSSGVAPYSYLWSNSATTAAITGVSGGTYTVTVTNATGSTTSSITITEPLEISITVTGTNDVSCKGGTDGSISIDVTGGTAPFTYLWNSGQVTEDISEIGAGAYSLIVTDANGCTDNLDITITEPADPLYITDIIAACDDYTWIDGITYTSDNATAQFTRVNNDGCEELVTLDLTISDKVTVSNTIQACDSYVWSVNNIRYAQSGTYTYLDAATCEEYTLYLSILPTEIVVSTIVECEAYYWDITNTTYTESTVITEVVNTGGQCISYTLNLTIEIAEEIEVMESSCDSYYWPINGTTYLESTTDVAYVYDPVNEVCEKYVLDITINSSTNNYTTVSACASYEWDINGTTYTNSGTYTYTESGSTCSTIETLYLTIEPVQDYTITQTATGSYYWALADTTFAVSGQYTHTLTIGGCPVTVTLDLTILTDPDPTPTVSVLDCETCIGSFSPVSGEKYVISAWVREKDASAMTVTFDSPSITIMANDGTTNALIGSYVATGLIIEGWQKIEEEFTIPSGTENIELILNADNSDVMYDDIRVYPFDASMKSFVYDPITAKLKAVLDELNYATFYEYDAEGNLVRIKKETEKGIMTIQETRSNTSQ